MFRGAFFMPPGGWMICGIDFGIPDAVGIGRGADAVSIPGPEATEEGCIWMLLGIAIAVAVFVPVAWIETCADGRPVS